VRGSALTLALTASMLARAPEFEPVQPELFARSGALANAWADFDLDGDLDLFVGFGGEPNRLYRNDSGSFVDVAASAGVADARATRASAWGDFDGDGAPDLLLGFAPGEGGVLRLYRNVGGRFVDVTAAQGLATDAGAVRQPVWVDFDGDADVDLFVAFRDRPNALFRNDRAVFTDVGAALGLADPRRSVGAVWFDFDEDGDLDLYVANMDGDANGLFRNDGGRFTDVAEPAGVAWGGRRPAEGTNGTVRPCAADVDGDGRLDLFHANYGPNGLFLNRGGGRFEDVSAAWGVAVDGRYDTCAFADFDNDGRLDLYVNGTVTGGVAYPDYLLHNTGSALRDETPADVRALAASHGAQWADFDGDGDLDLALAGSAADASHPLLRNELPAPDARRSLQVVVLDGRGRASRSGSEVRVFAAGTRQLLGTRLVDTGSGYDSQNVQPVHFGLPSLAPVDVEVTLPVGGVRRTARRSGVDPAAWTGRALEMRVDDDGTLIGSTDAARRQQRSSTHGGIR
jgi:hypothetical protein